VTQLTDDEIATIWEMGCLSINFVANMHNLGHGTIRGHMHYVHERDMKSPIAQGFYRWHRWLQSWGKQEKQDNPEPTEFIALCLRIHHKFGDPLAVINN
jgi:hypothetical protein